MELGSFRVLYERKRKLNSVLVLKESQLSEAKGGEMCSFLIILIRTLRAAFWTT